MKGIGTLLEAWELLRVEMGPACPKLIIGGDGPLRDEVEHRAQNTDTVEYAGQVSGDNKTRLISGCRAMIAPSVWWEPLGLVTYEAYDYGKPMLAARSGGLTETVINGKTGYLHEPGNAAEIVQHVLKLEQNHGLRREMGGEGRKWLLENTSEKVWREKFTGVIDSVLEK